MGAVGRKAGHPQLSLVKSGFNAPLQVVALERLNSQQDRLLNSYIKRTQLQGVCVGALIGVESWDIRPLIQESSDLQIIRFSSPLQSIGRKDFESLKELFTKLSLQPEIAEHCSFGIIGKQLWFKRKFYQSLMLDALKKISEVSLNERKQQALALIGVLKDLHASGIVHGHISASNVAWHDNTPIILDYGFAAHEMERGSMSFLAPEVRSHGIVEPAADIYGLGSLLQELLAKEMGHEEEKLVLRMTAISPAERPSLEEVANCVEYHFEVEEPTEEFSLCDVKRALKSNKLTDVQPNPRYHSLAAASDSSKAFTFEIDINRWLTSAVQANVLLATLVFLMFGSAYLIFSRSKSEVAQASVASFDYSTLQEYWNSGQPSMMQLVARAAIEDQDRGAQTVIIKDVLAGGKTELVKGDIVKTVFNPKWENQLSSEDRRSALILALSGLFDGDLPVIKSLNGVHPIVLLSITGTLQVDTKVSNFENISIKALTDLPDPYGETFKALQRIRAVNLQDSSLRALSHILLGDHSEIMLDKFIGSSRENLEMFKKLRVLSLVFDIQPGYDAIVYAHLISRSRIFAQTYSWFNEVEFAGWDKISTADKIRIVAGIYPHKDLSFEQYVDLLRFPNPRIASQAAIDINARFYKGAFTKMLNFIVGDKNRLSRFQTMSLLPAFTLKGQQATVFYSKWFKDAPDVESVLSVLLLRNDAEKDDRFNFHAALYLTDKNWDAQLEKLRQLVAHPEPLARALAYARLNKNNPQELQILKNMAYAETNKNLKDAIKRRLQG